MPPPADIAMPRPLVSIRGLQVFVAVLVALRLAFLFGVAPIGDEAYYWIWGQRLELSYFDHPPLNAWLLALSSHVFGWTVFGLRLPSLLTTGGTVWIFWLWAQHFAPAERGRWFWTATAVYLSTPIIALFSGMVFPDHLLIFLSVATIYVFSRFVVSWEAGTPRWRLLFGAAALLGLAALTKYSAVFVAAAGILYLLLSARRRQLLGTWQLYAAAVVTIAVFSPVLLWNLQHDFASFRFHLVDRHGDVFADLELERFGFFVLFAVLYIGPALVVPIGRMLFTREPGGILAAGREIGGITFVASSLFFGFLGAGIGALPYWNIVAYAALFPHVAGYIGNRLLLLVHFAYGIGVILLFLVNYAVVPLAALAGGSDWESAVVYGWDEIEQEVAVAEAEHHPGFLAATRYTLAAQLSFARGHDDVTALSPRIDQYDLWFDPGAHKGQSAVILADTGDDLDGATRNAFATVTELKRFDVVRFGRVMNTYIIYAATGFGEGPGGVPPRVE